MSRLAVLDSTVQKTHEWLHDIEAGLGFDDDRAAYAALRAVLHGLRDLLGADQVAHLGAQLPMLIRGIYYEGWNPSPAGRERRQGHAFFDTISHELRDHLELHDAERVARIVFGVIGRRLTTGEIRKIVDSLPREIRVLWPGDTVEDVQ